MTGAIQVCNSLPIYDISDFYFSEEDENFLITSGSLKLIPILQKEFFPESSALRLVLVLRK